MFWAGTGGGLVGPEPKLKEGWGGIDVTPPRLIKSPPKPVITGWGCGAWGEVLIDPKPSKSPPKPFEGAWTTGWVGGCDYPISKPSILKGSLFFGATGAGCGTAGCCSKLNPPNPVLKRLFCWFVGTGCLV